MFPSTLALLHSVAVCCAMTHAPPTPAGELEARAYSTMSSSGAVQRPWTNPRVRTLGGNLLAGAPVTSLASGHAADGDTKKQASPGAVLWELGFGGANVSRKPWYLLGDEQLHLRPHISASSARLTAAGRF